MDVRGFVPSLNDKAALVDACERIERNETIGKRDRDNNNNNNNNKNHKKNRFEKLERDDKKNGRMRAPSTGGPFFCTECGNNKTHSTNRCFKLKKIAAEQEERRNGHVKKFQAPYSKRTFRKEVNAMARRAGKCNSLKIVESAIKREKGKQAKQNSKTYAKAAVAKKNEENDSDSSTESMHNLEDRIPLKKKYATKYTTPRNVRYNSKGEVVAIEGDSEPDSDSEDDRKMPAKVSKKRAHKMEPLDTSSSDESDGDNKATAEEKAFLKAIGKKEKKNSAKDYKNESD
jgi:hypothetical protein